MIFNEKLEAIIKRGLDFIVDDPEYFIEFPHGRGNYPSIPYSKVFEKLRDELALYEYSGDEELLKIASVQAVQRAVQRAVRNRERKVSDVNT